MSADEAPFPDRSPVSRPADAPPLRRSRGMGAASSLLSSFAPPPSLRTRFEASPSSRGGRWFEARLHRASQGLGPPLSPLRVREPHGSPPDPPAAGTTVCVGARAGRGGGTGPAWLGEHLVLPVGSGSKDPACDADGTRRRGPRGRTRAPVHEASAPDSFCSKTASTCHLSTDGNSARNSSTVPPASRMSTSVATGTRVPANTS